MNLLTRIGVLILLNLMFSSTLVRAADDIEVGIPGIPGIDGLPGPILGEDGTDGQNGGDAIATAVSTDTTNNATASGGTGGNGGNGGAGGNTGGDGGNGGNGGNATANASTTTIASNATATATATGGDGGLAGAAGTGGIISGVPGVGGNGGAASANSQVSGGGGVVSSTAQATGGNGGESGDGGLAAAIASGSGTATVNISSSAQGGGGGTAFFTDPTSSTGNGGDGAGASAAANGTSSGTGPEFLNTASATATGGSGGGGFGAGFHGGNGASLTNAATASFVGDVATVSATQIGGAGGFGNFGAAGANGGDSMLTNCVTGAAALSITLSQTAIGGTGGFARDPGVNPDVHAGNGGNASSNLTFTNSLGGDVFGTSTAIGGRGGIGNGGGIAGDGGSAHGQIDLTGQGVVSATLIVVGGDGGSVLVGTGNAGNGADASIDSASINAHSTGNNALFFDAQATGGSGGVQEDNDADAGSGGNASVSVDKTASVSSLNISAMATGGQGGYISFNNGAPHNAGNGGSANASSIALNTNGAVRAVSQAFGGLGGSELRSGRTGDGGAASSNAQGTTLGDHLVDVSSIAQAGNAGGSPPTSSLHFLLQGGNGGDASSTASGSNNGISAVTVSSSAISGAGGKGLVPGFLSGPDGISGDATANSTASGLGQVTSTAMAKANFLPAASVGIASILHPVAGGDAVAHAAGTGQSGTAMATAQTGGGSFSNVGASATAPVGGITNVESQARMRGAAPTLAQAAGLQSAAFVTAGASDAPGALASIVQGASHPKTGMGIPATFNSEINLSIDLSQMAIVNNLQIHLLNSASTGAGFDMLSFQVFAEGAMVENDVFTDLASATAFFTGNTLDFGPAEDGLTGPLDLRFVFSLTTSSPGDSFGISYDVATNGAASNLRTPIADVPEPATWGLLLCGCTIFILARRKARAVVAAPVTGGRMMGSD